MPHRVNVMLEDDVWKILQKIPRGERSKMINLAVLSTIRSRQRKEACKRMDALAATLPAVSMAEIVSWLREDRERIK